MVRFSKLEKKRIHNRAAQTLHLTECKSHSWFDKIFESPWELCARARVLMHMHNAHAHYNVYAYLCTCSVLHVHATTDAE